MNAPRERLSISPGNIKTGRIPSVSLPHVVTCNRDAPCTIPDASGRRPCYMDKLVKLRPNVRAAYARNLRIWNADGAEYFEQLYAYLRKHAPRFFRFHVCGDYPSQIYFNGTIDTARAFPAVRFLAFTKQFHMLPRAASVPRNYSIVASMWPHWNVSRPTGYRCAWMTDGTETRQPSTAIECPGNCETCSMCWTLRTLRRDVIFRKH